MSARKPTLVMHMSATIELSLRDVKDLIADHVRRMIIDAGGVPERLGTVDLYVDNESDSGTATVTYELSKPIDRVSPA